MTKKIALYALLAIGFGSLAGCGGKSAQEKEAVAEIKSPSFDELMEKYSCLACHLPDNQMKLPSWEDVARRYKGVEAEGYLAFKIAKGGSGAWGTMDMPPYPEISKQDLKTMAQGILAYGSLKPAASAQKK
jgi:cytochrome c